MLNFSRIISAIFFSLGIFICGTTLILMTASSCEVLKDLNTGVVLFGSLIGMASGVSSAIVSIMLRPRIKILDELMEEKAKYEEGNEELVRLKLRYVKLIEDTNIGFDGLKD
jgi:uncharacterized membrane protein YgaE (UPF0421/DUF939 family)